MRIPEFDSRRLPDEHNHEEQTSLRMIWLVFAGWWLSLIWVLAGWLCVLVPPLSRPGLKMLGNITCVVALRTPGKECEDILSDTLWKLDHSLSRQHPPALRLLYALIIGWWVSLLWAALAWAESLSIERRPSGVARFMRLPSIMTLRRY